MKSVRKYLLLLLCFSMLPVWSTYAEDAGIRIVPPAGREDALLNLTDGNVETRLTLESQKSVLAEWDTKDAASLLLSWYEPADKVLIEVLDETGASVMREVTEKTPFKQHVNVTCGSAVRITSLSGHASLSELELIRVGEPLPYSDTNIQETDLLVICAGVTEECRLLGGLLPLYAGEHNMRTKIVYIRSDYGYVTGESFEARAALGSMGYPVFMRREDQNATQEERVQNLWKRSLMTDLWQIIRAAKPKVIVTLDPRDDSQPARTRVAAKTVRELVKTYSKKTEVPFQKCYILSGEGTTVMDWNVPLSAFGGQTAYEVACAGLNKYVSQRMYGYSVPKTSRFELIFTKVGEDTRRDDLLEHLDAASFISYAGQTPLPLPTAEPTPEPTAVPTVGSLSAPTGPKNGGLGLAVLCTACLTAFLVKNKKARYTAAALLLLLFALGTEITVRADETMLTAAAETSPQKELPGPLDDSWYRQSGEPEEVIVSDYPAGHWEYRSDDLSVLIDRETFTLDGHPQCIYVAYIRSRNTDCFHCGLASNADSNQLIMPWRLARTYKAVLAITGDNLVNAEKGAKGILIRNGELYSDCQGEDTLVIYSSQNIGLVKKNALSGIQLLDSGVRNSYSFGPVLVENGEVNPDVSKHRVAKGNPRCGLGILEEGCLMAIVADGRDPNRAYNLTLEEFAQIFKDKGADFAYNLDGGNSAAMIFMGESISCHSGSSGQRTWIDALLWGYSDQVPDTGDPILHNGEGKTGYYE